MSKLLDFLSYFAIFASGVLVGEFVMALVNAKASADKCAECQEKQRQAAILPGTWALTIGEDTWNVIPIVETPPIGEEKPNA